jgi:cell wall-associated NlpC family hydrolase
LHELCIPSRASLTVRPVRLRPFALVLGLTVLAVGPSPFASGQAGLEAQREQLEDAVAAEDSRLDVTREGLAAARRQLVVLTARAEQREAQLASAQQRLMAARIRLTRLQQRETASKRALAKNLVAQYKSGQPELVSVVLSTTKFSELYERVDFYRRVGRQNQRILDTTREAQAIVSAEAERLDALWTRYRRLAEEAVADRERADRLENALLVQERNQLARRNATASRLAGVRSRLAAVRRRAAAAAARSSAVSSSGNEAPAVSGDVVGRVVAAATQIASTPYVWGGGHGGSSGGYDCSGSISYALAAAGLLSGSLDSTGFMSYGDPGPGQRITIYANAGHAFMVVDGRRFDTSALSGGGTRWTSASRSTAGFVARHPPGL